MIEIKHLSDADRDRWDAYVRSHPRSNLYQLSGWKRVIEKTYGHRTYYLMAKRAGKGERKSEGRGQRTEDRGRRTADSVAGILPLVHLKHFVFGNNLVSMPYFDMGGILADDEESENALMAEAINLGKNLNVDTIELRHTQPLTDSTSKTHAIISNPINSTNAINPPKSVGGHSPTNPTNPTNPITLATRSHKVRMLLLLTESSEVLMKSFKSKLRSQIKKPIKEGLSAKIGGLELLDDFYAVFAVNMRDLGSPVHSKQLMAHVLTEFESQAKIVLVCKQSDAVACSLMIGFNDTLENPWASALRKYSRLSPNMLLYWHMLEYACDNGYRFFDFGRSTPDEGTYKFKKQWSAEPQPLNWQYVYLKGEPESSQPTDKSRFEKAIAYWQKLPVQVATVIGPRIRKYIAL